MHVLIAGKKQMNISFPSGVKYVGSLPFSEMPRFYNKADLVVLPSCARLFKTVSERVKMSNLRIFERVSWREEEPGEFC